MLALVGAVATVALLSGACTGDADGSGTPGTVASGEGPVATYPSLPFAELDTLLTEEVTRGGLAGAALVVDQDTERLHTFTTGEVGEDSALPVGETAAWLTAATLMSLVEDDLVALDDPVAPLLGLEAGSSIEGVTLRHLLSHTAGLPAALDCTGTGGCDAAAATAEMVAEPGEAFSVSPVGTHLAARVAEVVTGRAWSDVLDERLLAPLGTTATAFAEVGRVAGPTPGGPSPQVEPDTGTPTPPAAPTGLLTGEGTTTVADLGRFLTMVLAKGATADGRVLEEASVEEMERDQTARLDTSTEPWVAATGIPTYGLGVWRDRLRGDGTNLASVVSAPSRAGVYPLVERPRNAWAVVVVLDEAGSVDPAGPLDAVTDAAAVAQRVGVAIDTDGRAIRRPGTPLLPDG